MSPFHVYSCVLPTIYSYKYIHVKQTQIFSFLLTFPIQQFLGDIIIKEGTIGSKMYFIQEGIVDIVMANGEVSTNYPLSVCVFG